MLAPAAGQSQAVPSIRKVQVLRSSGQVEIEIEASDRVVPQVHAISNPDRLLVDFVNATPGAGLRSQVIHRGDVKNLRVGLFSADPPVTRIVLDLNGPQPYQIFPSGRTVIVKVGSAGGAQTAAYHPALGPLLTNANYPAEVEPIAPPPAPKPLEVSFRDGLLTIISNKANLSEILFAVHQRTGAEIAIPAGAEQEKVMAELGPAPAPEVLAHLLNGTKFNFLILSSAADPRALDQVILSPRAEGPASMQSARPQPLPQVAAEDDASAEPPPAPPVRPPPPTPTPNPDGPPQNATAPASNDGPD
jgi:hypothetical protein